MYRISVNGEYLEINSKSKIQLNRTVFDLQDITKRGVRFTNALTVPSTAKNLRLLGSPDRLSSDNLSFEKTVPYILEDANTIVSQGRIIVKSYNQKKGVKIQMSEGVDFWDQADKKQLNEVPVHDEDFLFNTSNMNARKVKGSSIFLTSLMDARGDKTNTALDNYNYTRPCYVYRNLMDRMAIDLGYQIDYGDVLPNTQLDSIGFMSNTRDFFVTDYKRRYQMVEVDGTLSVGGGTSLVDIGNNTTLSGDALTNGLYKTGYVIKGTFTAQVDTRIEFVFSDRTELVLIPKGTSFVNFKTDDSEIGVSLEIRTSEPVIFEDVYLYSIVSESSIFDIDEEITLAGMWVLGDYNLPIMTYKQFFKVVLSMFFLDVDIDNSNKILKLSRLGASFNTNNFIDLSKKVVRNNEWKSGKVYGRLNTLGYSNDDDVDINLGRVFFSIDNENAKPTKQFVEVERFSASNESNVSGNRVVSVPIYSIIEPSRTSVNDRIVFFNQSGSFGYNATFSEVSFQRLYSDQYFDFIDSTKRERLVQFSVFLNKIDFDRIQSTPIIYIDFLESYFLVSKISGFDQEELCKIDTVKYG